MLLCSQSIRRRLPPKEAKSSAHSTPHSSAWVAFFGLIEPPFKPLAVNRLDTRALLLWSTSEKLGLSACCHHPGRGQKQAHRSIKFVAQTTYSVKNCNLFISLEATHFCRQRGYSLGPSPEACPASLPASQKRPLPPPIKLNTAPTSPRATRRDNRPRPSPAKCPGFLHCRASPGFLHCRAST